jgi:hypothetical protein
MATNLKGKGKFVSLLLLHGEKIAIGLVAAIALWFVYSSWSLPHLGDNFQAEKLQNEITQTNSEIKNFSWDAALKDHPDKVKKAQPIAAKGIGAIDPKRYVIGIDANGKPEWGIDESIVAPLIRREDPPILNAIDVRATGGSGLFAFVDEDIRKKQALKMAEEQKELERKAAERAKKEAKAAERGTTGRNRPGEGPGGYNSEPIDPNHPKRRQVQGSFRPTGNSLQGGERIERAYWACVVAKVPIREQLQRFQDALEKARGANPERDFPGYVGYFVERADVLPGKELDWKAVPLYDGQRQSVANDKSLTNGPSHVIAAPAFDSLVSAAQQYWAGGPSQDVIDSRFAVYPLTLPLPPLVGREWGSEATHPDIPLAINTPPLETETQQPGVQPGEAPKSTPSSDFGTAAPVTAQGPGMGQSFGYGGARPGSEYPGGARFGSRFGSEGGPGMYPGMPPGGRGYAMMGQEGGPGGFRGGSSGPGQVAQEHVSLPKGVDYYLLRFFDFSVEPGKKYKYRVKLVLKDPNYGLPQMVLAPAVLDRQAKELQAARAKNPKAERPFYRIVDQWSDPSPSVGIPTNGNVRLADVKVPSSDKANDEPTVKLLVEAFDVDDSGMPIQAATEKDFKRGYVANMVQDTEYLVDAMTIDTQKDFKFFTGMTLLDVDGGAKIPGTRDMTYPARILVMGPAGELYIHDELDEKSYVETHRAIFEKNPTGAMGPEGPGGPGRPGGRRGSPRR